VDHTRPGDTSGSATGAGPGRFAEHGSSEEGYRYHVLPSSYGGVEQRSVLIASEPRQPHAKRTVTKQLLKQSAQEVHALKKLCRNTFACEADARQALAAFAHVLQDTYLHESTVCPTPRYGKRGRPSPGTPPDHVVYHIQGTLASCLAVRQALIEQHSCFILATNELDETTLSPQEVLNGYKGQPQAERSFRFLKIRVFWPRRSISKSLNALWPC
jgi:transposase